jgi:hypothetical protein
MIQRLMMVPATAVLALGLIAPGAAVAAPKAGAAKTSRAVCCPNHPASHAKCCKSGRTADCCHNPAASKKGGTAVCAITGKPLAQCCGSKASQMPPCCQKGCKTAGKKVQ